MRLLLAFVLFASPRQGVPGAQVPRSSADHSAGRVPDRAEACTRFPGRKPCDAARDRFLSELARREAALRVREMARAERRRERDEFERARAFDDRYRRRLEREHQEAQRRNDARRREALERERARRHDERRRPPD